MKVLIISDYIAPLSSIASVRWTKLGKYMAKRGNTVDILTAEHSYSEDYLGAPLWGYDEMLAQDLRWFNEIFTAKNGFIARAIYKRVNRQRIASLKQNNNAEVVSGQKPEAKAKPVVSNTAVMVAASLFACQQVFSQHPELAQRYDVVISSFAPYWTHMVAKEFKRRNPEIIWLADYRDFPACKVFGANEYNKNFARRYTDSADVILTVSDPVWTGLLMDESMPHALIQNGYDSEESSGRKRLPSKTFSITYTGTLYSSAEAKSDLRPLFRAIQTLQREGRIQREDVVVQYAGRSSQEFVNQASDFSDVTFENLGLLPRLEAFELQNKASALAFCTWNTTDEKSVTTGKIYEYLSSDVPIIGLCSGNEPQSHSKEMIELSGSGFCYEEANRASDQKKLEEHVYQLYRQWKAQGVTSYEKNQRYIDQFSYEKLSAKVLDIINVVQEVREDLA